MRHKTTARGTLHVVPQFFFFLNQRSEHITSLAEGWGAVLRPHAMPKLNKTIVEILPVYTLMQGFVRF